MRNVRRQTGFTLVELMIAMVLGILLTGALLTMLTQARQSFKQDETFAGMQDESRFAMQELTRDISMAGFVGEILSPDSVEVDASLNVGTDCGTNGGEPFVENLIDTASKDPSSLMAVDNITTAAATNMFSCLVASELVAGTDIIAIKRLEGSDSTDDVDAGEIAIRQNGTAAILYQDPIVNAAYIAAPYNERLYAPAVYFVRNYTNVVGDGIPSLCRMVVVPGATVDMETECIAQGIEDMQIEYGLDTDLIPDGSVDRYVTDPTADELLTAISARIYLLARTADIDVTFTDTKTYRMSNAADYTPNDSFRRRVYTTTVSIPNVRRLLMVGST